MLPKKRLWIILALVNLCLTTLLGVTLRTKFLFPIPFIDYRNFLSAHSHFAFGGWVTLTLMIFYIDGFLSAEQGAKKAYQFILWGIELTSLGMAISFPFKGYAFFSIVFSTAFIFFTYIFSWIFIRDFLNTKREKSVSIVVIAALASLVISSIGPFTLAYLLASKSGNAILYRDAIYTYLHFQYNGFFTLSVFAIFFNHILQFVNAAVKQRIYWFSVVICLSVIPSLFLSLTWHPKSLLIHSLAIVGCILVFMALLFFLRLMSVIKSSVVFRSTLARMLWIFSMISFGIKMLLQVGIIIPSLATAVFGYRPIIIGFLHLVFLGFVTFYILGHLTESGAFSMQKKFSKTALLVFSIAIFLNEAILLTQGLGLMFSITSRLYPWLLWLASILLFTGSLLILIAGAKTERVLDS